MFPCTVSQLSDIIDGVPAEFGPWNDCVAGASIDTRSIQPGEAFFALSGTKNHGVLFADEAVSRGAACVVTDFSRSPSAPERPDQGYARLRPADSVETDRRIIRVANSQEALRKLAIWNRQQSQGLIVGITGSVGKTTTREMIAAVLGSQFSGIQSPHNYNNELGVPLSLIRLSPEHDFGVLEMGAGKKGDIALLAEMATPEFAVVTRVSAAHLESFGGMDVIRQTKQELPASVPAGGTVFLNADDGVVRSMASATAATVVLFGLSEAADIRATHVSVSDGVCSLLVDGSRFRFAGGRHLVTCALAAVAVGRVTGIDDVRIAQGLEAFQPDAGRGRIVQRTPWTIIDDSYNASPASVHAAMTSLGDWSGHGHRILVLGDMMELGRDAEKFHFEAGKALGSTSISHALLLGRYADTVAAGARAAGVSLNRVSVFQDVTTLQTMLECLLTAGDIVLIKGSRAMHMEQIVRWLRSQSAFSQDRSAA